MLRLLPLGVALGGLLLTAVRRLRLPRPVGRGTIGLLLLPGRTLRILPHGLRLTPLLTLAARLPPLHGDALTQFRLLLPLGRLGLLALHPPLLALLLLRELARL